MDVGVAQIVPFSLSENQRDGRGSNYSRLRSLWNLFVCDALCVLVFICVASCVARVRTKIDSVGQV